MPLGSDEQLTLVSSSSSDLAATVGDAGGAGAAVALRRSPHPDDLVPGTVLLNRYEVLSLLGHGGMGAVYKARDRELDRFVALKVIHPEFTSNPDIVERFKQEIILASKVTHKNVIRIYDFGDSNGMKFITMEFIEGEDLGGCLARQGKIPPDEAVGIMRQVCRALDAAHSEGVIHRDLKPQNIMRAPDGRVLVMDFGLARLTDSRGLTQTGALVGTLVYMSPEQAMSAKLDARSDLFSFGLIFYELLTGARPYKADSEIASLLKRSQEPVEPLQRLDTSIPRALSDVVCKCLERLPEQRYQSAREILVALDKIGTATSRVSRSRQVFSLSVIPSKNRRLIFALPVLLVLVVAAIFAAVHVKRAPSQAAGPVASVAILQFRNASGDPKLEWLGPSLAEMLNSELAHSQNLRTVSTGRMQQVLHDLRIPPDAVMDEPTIARFAEFSNAENIISGQFIKLGDRYRIDATLANLKTKRNVPLKIEASNEQALTASVSDLARSIQQELAVPVRDSEQKGSLQALTQSVEGLRAYNQGLVLARESNHIEATKQFQAAIAADGNFAMAHSRLAESLLEIGQSDQAEKAVRDAMQLAAKLPKRERLLIEANNARIFNDHAKSIQAYEQLAKDSPQDSEVRFGLARLYEESDQLDRAGQEYRKVLEFDPKYVDALLSLGRVEIKRGAAPESLDPLNKALSLSVQFENQQSKGTILHAIGVAYRTMDQPQEALRYFRDSLEIKRKIGDKRGIAVSLNESAHVYGRLGNTKEALSGYQEALAIRREMNDRKGMADSLLDLGNIYSDLADYESALKYYQDSLQLQVELGNVDHQSLCLHDIGNVYLSMARYSAAKASLERALQMREKADVPEDTADTVHNLAETYLQMGQLDTALTYYLRELDVSRKANYPRGVAQASNGLGSLFALQGRFGAALGAQEDASKAFDALNDRSYWLVEMRSGHGHALGLIGRFDEGIKKLDEAFQLAGELKLNALGAQVLNHKAEILRLRGNLSAARSESQKALQVATRSHDARQVLVSRLSLAEIAVRQQQASSAIRDLRKVRDEADSMNAQYLSIEATVSLGEALLLSKNLAEAKQELAPAAERAEKMGARLLAAEAHWALARSWRVSGNEQAADTESAIARRMAAEIRDEAKSQQITQRADLAELLSEPQTTAKK